MSRFILVDHDPSGDDGDLVKSQERTDPYYRKRQQALVWLGDRYLLAQPVGRNHAMPSFLRPQI